MGQLVLLRFSWALEGVRMYKCIIYKDINQNAFDIKTLWCSCYGNCFLKNRTRNFYRPQQIVVLGTYPRTAEICVRTNSCTCLRCIICNSPELVWPQMPSGQCMIHEAAAPRALEWHRALRRRKGQTAAAGGVLDEAPRNDAERKRMTSDCIIPFLEHFRMRKF